jgi:hypothetical protein
MNLLRLDEICRPVPTQLSSEHHTQGKRVALISKAPSLENTNLGPEIDSYDMVVRVNQPFEFPSHLHKDYGSRTDAVYDTMNDQTIKLLNHYWDSHAGRELIATRKTDQIKNLRSDINFRYAHKSIINFRRKNLIQTGILAAMDILKDPNVSELFIAGYDFYTTANNYTDDYSKKVVSVVTEGALFKTAQNNGVWHNQKQQAKFFSDFVASDPRVKLHAATARALEIRLKT